MLAVGPRLVRTIRTRILPRQPLQRKKKVKPPHVSCMWLSQRCRPRDQACSAGSNQAKRCLFQSRARIRMHRVRLLDSWEQSRIETPRLVTKCERANGGRAYTYTYTLGLLRLTHPCKRRKAADPQSRWFDASCKGYQGVGAGQTSRPCSILCRRLNLEGKNSDSACVATR